MKKLFILIAFLMLSGAAMAEPQVKDLQATVAKPLIQQPMSANHNSILENLFLNQKGDRFLADGEEVYTNMIAQGQIFGIGPSTSTYIAYDPASKYIFGLSTARWSGYGEDTIRKIGMLMYGKYEHKKKLQLQRQFYFDTTDLDPYETEAAPGKNIDNWNDPTLIVANPEGSADVSKLKLAFSTVMSRFNRNVTPDFDAGDPKPRYNTISIMNGDKLASTNDDPTFKEGVSFVNLDQPDPNATSADIGGYYFNRPLKGVAAQIDGIPYSIFFGPLINDGAKTTNPVHFGIVSVALADIPAVGQRNSLGENLQTMQVLPPEVTDIFTTTSLQPTEVWYSTAHGFNIDTDDEGNIYIALHEANKKNAESDMNTEEFRNLRVPTVVKTKYNTSTTTDKDFNIGGYTVETMPFSALKKYIEDRGGWFDTTNKNSAPIFDYYTVASTDRQWSIRGDIPFVVSSANNSHFIMPLMYILPETPDIADDIELAKDIVEVINSNGNWTIKSIAHNHLLEFSMAMNNSGDMFPSFGMYYTDANGLLHHGNGGNEYSGINPCLDLQISRTEDKQYLVAKWQMADTLSGIKLSAPVTYTAGSEANTIEITSDTMWAPSLFLSYRHVHPDSNWSVPIRASHLNYPEKAEDFDPLRDTISFMGTVMPRVIPSINEVIISYSYFIDQGSPSQLLVPDKIMKHRANAYRYNGIIVPSAVTGPGYVGIEEGEPATTDHLSPVYPNPVDNTVNFSFSLLKPAYTRLTISNSLGQEVAVVVDQFCNASQYNWNDYSVSNLPAGIYYFTLTSGDVRQTKIFTIAR